MRSLSFVNKILILIGKPLKMDFRGIYDNTDMFLLKSTTDCGIIGAVILDTAQDDWLLPVTIGDAMLIVGNRAPYLIDEDGKYHQY